MQGSREHHSTPSRSHSVCVRRAESRGERGAGGRRELGTPPNTAVSRLPTLRPADCAAAHPWQRRGQRRGQRRIAFAPPLFLFPFHQLPVPGLALPPLDCCRPGHGFRLGFRPGFSQTFPVLACGAAIHSSLNGVVVIDSSGSVLLRGNVSTAGWCWAGGRPLNRQLHSRKETAWFHHHRT